MQALHLEQHSISPAQGVDGDQLSNWVDGGGRYSLSIGLPAAYLGGAAAADFWQSLEMKYLSYASRRFSVFLILTENMMQRIRSIVIPEKSKSNIVPPMFDDIIITPYKKSSPQ